MNTMKQLKNYIKLLKGFENIDKAESAYTIVTRLYVIQFKAMNAAKSNDITEEQAKLIIAAVTEKLEALPINLKSIRVTRNREIAYKKVNK